jgi:hypothetical protein
MSGPLATAGPGIVFGIDKAHTMRQHSEAFARYSETDENQPVDKNVHNGRDSSAAVTVASGVAHVSEGS